jgi:hypothetical protein
MENEVVKVMNTEWKSGLRPVKSRAELIDMYYLDIRSALLEAAAFFDRLDGADDGSSVTDGDERVARLRELCGMVASERGERVRRILEYLSGEEAS